MNRLTHMPLPTACLLVLVLAACAGCARLNPAAATGRTWYLDSRTGDDRNNGQTPETAWRTLDRVRTIRFGPRDRLLLRAGGRWTGGLQLHGAGSQDAPVIVGRYGDGPPPLLAGEGKVNTVVMLRNGRYWEITDLEITNTIPGGKRRNNMHGLTVLANAGGVFQHIVLRRLHVHHVSGGWDRHGGAGIWLRSYGDSPKYGTRKSRFDGVLIEDCYIHNVSFYGIMLSGWENRYRDERWFPSRNVVVRNNFTHDTGGDSIVLLACDHPLIEHNEAHRCCIGQLHGGKTAAVGMWPHSCDSAVLRYNRVVDNQGVHDGEAFDVDNNCRDTLVEYNWSWNNPGGFLLVCSAPDEPSPTHGVTVRYNLSIGDGRSRWGRIVCIAGPVRDITFENNVFLEKDDARVAFFSPFDYGKKSWGRDVSFGRNVFATAGTFDFLPKGVTGIRCLANVYAGRFQGWPEDPQAETVPYPAVSARNGWVQLPPDFPVAHTGCRPFDVRSAGLLPSNTWLEQRDDSLRRSLP